MIENYLTNITPDSLSGLIFAFEGIKKTIVLLNGPTGCKFYHSATSDNQAVRQSEFDPLNYPELWYFGQPRVPCTYLDKSDYVYGSEDKLKEAIDFLYENIEFELLVIINSPGAALIGDDIGRIAEAKIKEININASSKKKHHMITIESPGFSENIWDGYVHGCKAMIDNISLPKKKTTSGKVKVNLIGMSIFHKFYEGNLIELERLLKLCSIDINCTLGCMCSVEEIEKLAEADFNIVLDPIYGLKIAKYLEEKYETAYVSQGLPIGFAATERLIEKVCQMGACDISAFTENAERARARSYIFFSRINSLTGLPKGVTFAVHGNSGECLAYCEFLINYMAMEPDCISLLDDIYEDEIRSLLEARGRREALDKNILDTDAMIVFSDANIISKLKAKKHEFTGVEIALPSMGYTDIIPKSNMGISGALYICEQVINGIIY